MRILSFLVILGLGLTHNQALVLKPSFFNSIFSIFVSDNSIEAESSHLPKGLDSGPPPHEEAARMARYVTHHSGNK